MNSLTVIILVGLNILLSLIVLGVTCVLTYKTIKQGYKDSSIYKVTYYALLTLFISLIIAELLDLLILVNSIVFNTGMNIIALNLKKAVSDSVVCGVMYSFLRIQGPQ